MGHNFHDVIAPALYYVSLQNKLDKSSESYLYLNNHHVQHTNSDEIFFFFSWYVLLFGDVNNLYHFSYETFLSFGITLGQGLEPWSPSLGQRFSRPPDYQLSQPSKRCGRFDDDRLPRKLSQIKHRLIYKTYFWGFFWWLRKDLVRTSL